LATSLVINGVTYSFPSVDDTDWGQNVSDWAAAVTNGMLQKSGGTFTLTADVDFGATYGLKAGYFISKTANVASAGQVRLANADTVKWRNSTNASDLALAPASDTVLAFAGVNQVNLTATQTLTNKTLTTPIFTAATSGTANAADAGAVRLANADVIDWRNSGNSGNLALQPGSDTELQFAGIKQVNLSGSQTLTNKTLTSPVVNTPSVPTYEDWTETTTPGSPAASTRRVYYKSDGILYKKNSAGTETQVAPVITAWTSFVPTGSWVTNTTYTGFYRRVGEQLEVEVMIALAGTPTSGGSLTITLPNSYSVDTAKTVMGNTSTAACGIGNARDAGVTNYTLIVVYNTTTTVKVKDVIASGTYATQNEDVDPTHPISFGNADEIYVRFSVPIASTTVYS
jgi:hypothetical protein